MPAMPTAQILDDPTQHMGILAQDAAVNDGPTHELRVVLLRTSVE
jgi:hypothetical protein